MTTIHVTWYDETHIVYNNATYNTSGDTIYLFDKSTGNEIACILNANRVRSIHTFYDAVDNKISV